MHGDARGHRGLADADREAQRMQMPRARVEETGDVALAGYPLGNLVPFQEPELPIAEVVFLLALPLLELVALARLDADVHVPPAQAAVDLVAHDEVARELDALDAVVPEPLGIALAELRGELRHPAGV